MTIKMYDLAGAEADRRFSPYCWRTKLALAHKQLEVKTIPWRLRDKPLIAFANWERVPVIIDQGKPVVDSWAIATYLENTYPSPRSTTDSPCASRARARLHPRNRTTPSLPDLVAHAVSTASSSSAPCRRSASAGCTSVPRWACTSIPTGASGRPTKSPYHSFAAAFIRARDPLRKRANLPRIRHALHAREAPPPPWLKKVTAAPGLAGV
jgi:hypothetical protein